VTTPQSTAQRVAKRAALMADKVNQEVMGVVENMSWFTGDDGTRYALFGEGGVSDVKLARVFCQAPTSSFPAGTKRISTRWSSAVAMRRSIVTECPS